ncbi:sugar ABC transporter ATP-binding protein, partial [Lactococcus lactis]
MSFLFFNYSVEELKAEIVSQNPSKSRRVQREVTEELKNKKDNHKLSLMSKVIVWLCLLAFIWITLVSLSNATLAESLRHPKTFFTERLFKSDTRNMTSTTKKEAVVKTSSSPKKKVSQAKKTTKVSS